VSAADNHLKPPLPVRRSSRLQTALRTEERSAAGSRGDRAMASSQSESTLEDTKIVDPERYAGEQCCSSLKCI
jgi:hypothetical protein